MSDKSNKFLPSKNASPSTWQQNSLSQNVGRGAQGNIDSRYLKNKTEPDLENFGWMDEDDRSNLRTEFFPDSSRSLVTDNDSPDLKFTYSANPYRGCEHGCIYCYARPTHEYLNLSAGLDFESKIFVKYEAAELLRKKLSSRSWSGETIFFSGVTDCYQPIERKLQITRSCMEVLLEFKNPTAIITKNHLIRRDIDIFRQMNEYQGVMIYLSITTLDESLCRVMEPRTSLPELRLKAIEEISAAGIPVGVNVAPIIPGLTDHELPAILKAAAEAGAKWAGYVPVRLPLSVAPLFEEWLDTVAPTRKAKILSAIRSIRDGKLNDANFGSRMRGQGARADTLREIFQVFTKKYGFNQTPQRLSSESFKKPPSQDEQAQLSFDIDP